MRKMKPFRPAVGVPGVLLFLMICALAQSVLGQALLSLNQPVTASSFQSGNYATNGNDGNLTTRWAAATATFPQWWQVDLGATQAISQVVVDWYNAASRAYQYEIQISNDGNAFSTVVNATNNSAFGNTTNTFSALARYVRINVTSCSASGAFASFYEGQVYGPALTPSPHVPDANTLFLFHLDEAAGGSVTTNLGTAGGNAFSVNSASATTTPPVVTNVLGAASYSGFGNAAAFSPGELIGYDNNRNGAYDGDASASQLSADAMPMSNLNMGNGSQTPWTLEALICPSAINTANQEIICTDSSSSSGRGFQFRIDNVGELELNLIAINGADLKTAIPTTTTDPVNGFVSNNWYHVAATYDGTNVVLYWTKMSATATAANPISTNAVVVGASFGAVQGPLGIGNRTRGAGSEYFQGLIDEVRISNIVRSPVAMLNVSGLPAAGMPSLSPASTPVYAGTAVTLAASVSGDGPFTYAWQTDGSSGGSLTNIPGGTTDPFTFNTAGMASGAYRFDLVVSNSSGSATSTAVTMILTNASGLVIVSDTQINPASTFAGSPVGMSASFAGTQPVSYQWYFDNAPIPGATNETYSIAGVQVSNSGSYFLLASNNPPGLGGLTGTSTPETLLVAPLPAGPVLTNTVAGLVCELLEHPELTEITAPNPAFGWAYVPVFRNDSQTGYHVIVASSQALAASGTGDLWDSGWVLSSNSINVRYAGNALQPNTSYYWRVQTVDSAGQVESFSAVQQFNTAGTLVDPLAGSGVIYQPPSGGSLNSYPPAFVPAVPVLITNTAPGTWFIDFGQDAFGYATVHANGNFSGTNVVAGFGEMASGNAVDTSPPSGSCVRYGATTFTLQNGSVLYSVRPPSFNGDPDAQLVNPPSALGTVLPFRYLELMNFPGTLTVTDVVQERLATEFDTNAAAFSSSSAALNQVWNLCRNSMQWLSFDGIYVDGDRERTPYEADSYIHQLSSYGVNNDFTTVRCSFEYLVSHPTWPTEWKLHMILIAWADYLQTGNTNLLAKYYSALQADSFTWAATGSGLMRGFPNFPQSTNSDIVDWPANDRDGFVISSGSYLNYTNSVNNAFYYRCLQLMSNIASVIGRTNDAATYAADAEQVYAAYNAAFWNGISYVDGVGTSHASAHANFFPLAFGLVPAANQTAVLSYIHSRIAADNGMPPSVYGAQYLMQALFEAGDADTAIGLLTTNGTRSWMNMINIGSTLTDEAWSLSDKSNEDWNHAWGAAAGNIIANYVLGLRPLTAGYGQILIQPQLGTSLPQVQGTVPTIRGPVSISATNAAGQMQLLVNIPGNVTATVMLPAGGATNPVALVDGAVVSGVLSNNWLTVTNVGSGQHAIWLNTNSVVSSNTLYGNWAASWYGTNVAAAAMAAPSANPGFNNYDAFVAGLNPTDPHARFTAGFSTNNATNLVISIPALSGRTYVLQRSLGLSPAAWTGVVTNGTLFAQTLQFSDPQPPATQVFYRILVTMP